MGFPARLFAHLFIVATYTVALSGLYPDKVVLALEIREKVSLVVGHLFNNVQPDPSIICVGR